VKFKISTMRIRTPKKENLRGKSLFSLTTKIWHGERRKMTVGKMRMIHRHF